MAVDTKYDTLVVGSSTSGAEIWVNYLIQVRAALRRLRQDCHVFQASLMREYEAVSEENKKNNK